MEYKIDLGVWGSIFAVPSCIVDQHIKVAGSVSLKVLLIFLRNADKNISTQEIAQLLKIPAADVEDALNYWADAGVLVKQGQVISPVKETESKSVVSTPPKPSENHMPVKETQPASSFILHQHEKTVKFEAQPPHPSPSEVLARQEENQEIRFLLNQAENILAKMLPSSYTSSFVWQYDCLGLPADVIIMLIQYCCEIGKKNISYIEKTAIGWYEAGINTHEKAAAYITAANRLHKNAQLVKYAFGITSRNLTSKEEKYIKQWFEEMQFGIDMVKLAFEICADNTGKMSFAYIHKILESWHAKGLHTPKQVSEENQKRQETKEQGPSFNLDNFAEMIDSYSPNYKK